MVEQRRGQGRGGRTTWLTGILVALMTALLAGATLAAPAQAADSTKYLKNSYYGGWVFTAGAGRAALTGVGGSYPQTVWRYQPRGTLNGHDLVKFQSNYDNYCLDSHASTTQVWEVGCNTGSYQLWEVFAGPSGSQIYKSYGAYVNQGAHVCMSATNIASYLILTTCDTTLPMQQWKNSRT